MLKHKKSPKKKSFLAIILVVHYQYRVPFSLNFELEKMNNKPLINISSPINKTKDEENNSIEDINSLMQSKIIIQDKKEIIFLDKEDIMYVEASGSYTQIITRDGKKHVLSKNLKSLEKKLGHSQFYRSHKSFLVNLSFIKKFVKADGGYLLTFDDKIIPVSARKKRELLKILNSYAM